MRLLGPLPRPGRCGLEESGRGPSPLLAKAQLPWPPGWAAHQTPHPVPWTSCPEILRAPARYQMWVVLGQEQIPQTFPMGTHTSNKQIPYSASLGQTLTVLVLSCPLSQPPSPRRPI